MKSEPDPSGLTRPEKVSVLRVLAYIHEDVNSIWDTKVLFLKNLTVPIVRVHFLNIVFVCIYVNNMFFFSHNN